MKKNTKRVVIVLFFAMVSWALLRPVETKAASTSMKIYDIYLGNTSEGGDAVLIESNGEYLLMDMGTYEQTENYVIPLLKKLNVKSLSIYFSHMHIDHTGSLPTKLTAGLDAIHDISGLKIKNLYLPDESIVTTMMNQYSDYDGDGDTDSVDSEIGNDLAAYVGKYERFVNAYQAYGDTTGQVVRLKKGSKFSFESVTAKVLGPLGVDRKYSLMGADTDRYENNMSLVTKLSCGSVSYLTGGDTMDAQEALLVSAYGSDGQLDADILKLSHHGTSGANSEEFIKEVSPSYSFAQNSSYTGYLDSGNKWRKTYSALNAARKYGFYYLTANEKKNLIFSTADDQVSMYQSSVSSANRLTGWVTVTGGTGLKNDTTDEFYIGSNGRPYQGVKKIGGKYYWFSTNIIRGKYSVSSNSWNPLYAVNGTHRYFNTDSGVMYVGFKTIDGKSYYFDANGYRVVGSSSWKLKKLNGSYYAMNQNGVIAKKSWKKFSGKYRYFDSTGKMLTGLQKIGSETYYFDLNGYRLDSGFKKIGGYKYYFGASGKAYRNVFRYIGKYKYHFDQKGHTAISKVVRISKSDYYFDSSGHMVKNKIVKIEKYRYYFSQSGQMIKGKTVEVNGKRYKIDVNGRIKG